ncbi:MAG: NYN domain-containing protein [Candidatus Kentron sp. G]|nr:MAG: NYN domain-containing protein [Candidatus Kentron sp. G]
MPRIWQKRIGCFWRNWLVSSSFPWHLGEVVHRGWQVPARFLPGKQDSVTLTHEHLKPNIQQKGVDMRIGLDIASLTLKRHVGIIVLVTGDSDFVPAMKFARREGAQLYLVTLGQSVREDMVEHADLILTVVLRPSKFEGHCPMIRHGCRMALMVALNWSVECVKEES